MLARVTVAGLHAEAAARGPAARGHPLTSEPTDDHVGSRGRGACVAERTLRVCALYPDLMNIYADRGNLLLLERRCAWRGHRLRAARAPGSATRSTPTPTTCFYIGGGQDRDQALCARDLADDQARRAARRRRPRRGRSSPSAAATSCSATRYELGGERLPGVGLVDLETVREDGPRLIGNVAIEVELDGPHASSPASRTTAGARASDRARSPLGRVLRGHGNDGRSGYEGVRGGAHGTVVGTYLHGPLLPKNALVRRLADRHGARRDAVRAARARRRARGRGARGGAPGRRDLSPREPIGYASGLPPPGDSSVTTANTAQSEGPSALPRGSVAGVPRRDQALPRRRPRPPSTRSRLEVPAGEICVLVGPSGCGKTTAMRMVNRMIDITERRHPRRRAQRARARRRRPAARDRLRDPADRPVPAPHDRREHRHRPAAAGLGQAAHRAPASRSCST